MSDAVQSGMLVFLTSGAFVGIAFQPPFWYFVAMGVCLRAYVWHAERVDTEGVKGWRLAAQRARDATLNSGRGGGNRLLHRWRSRHRQVFGEAVARDRGNS